MTYVIWKLLLAYRLEFVVLIGYATNIFFFRFYSTSTFIFAKDEWYGSDLNQNHFSLKFIMMPLLNHLKGKTSELKHLELKSFVSLYLRKFHFPNPLAFELMIQNVMQCIKQIYLVIISMKFKSSIMLTWPRRKKNFGYRISWGINTEIIGKLKLAL